MIKENPLLAKNVINLFPDTNHLPNIKEGQMLKYLESKHRKDGYYNHWFKLIDNQEAVDLK